MAEAFVLLPTVHQLQQRLAFERWHALLERSPGGVSRSRARLGDASAADIAWAVEVAGSWLPGSYKCLPRAYAAHVLLARYGHLSEVQVGVARDAEGKVEAHAWVVCGGDVVVGNVEDLARFVRLPALSRALS